MSRLARGASLTLGARVLSLGVGLVASIVVARALGPVGKGAYALIVLIPALLQLAGGLGLEQSTVFLVAPRRERARSIASTLAVASAALGVVLIGIYAALARVPAFDRYLAAAGVEPGFVWILVAVLPGALATQSLASAILALERYRAYNLATLVPPAVNLALLIVLVVLLDLGVGGAVAATGTATLIGLAATGALLYSSAPPGRARLEPRLLREAFRYGWRAHIANVAWFVHYRADMFLVGYLAGPAALGFYSIAVGLAEKLYIAPSAIGTVLFPRVAAAGDRPAGSLTARASRHTLWLTLALAVALAAVAHPLIHLLFGSDFLPATTPLWLLLPGVVSLAVGRVISADLNGRGMPGVVARANAAMAVVNVGLNLWWIPVWGVAGAAAATSVSYSAAVILLAARYRRASGTRWADLVAFGRADLADLRRALGALGLERASGDTVSGGPPP